MVGSDAEERSSGIDLFDNYKIYVHINKINGKLYFGQTKQENVKDRWDSGHGYKTCVAFNRAIEKYGWNNFDHIVLFEGLTLEMANLIETELIKKYETTNPKYGYNITSGGLNFKMSEQTKEKLRQNHLGKHNSEISKEKLKQTWRNNGHPRKGKHHTEETKNKISQANTGCKHSQEQIDYISEMFTGKGNPFYGKRHTDETKKKISEYAKERFSDYSNNPFYGKHHTDEAKERMSEAHKKIPKEKHGRYGKKISQYTKDAIRKSHIKEVIQYDKNNNEIEHYDSIVNAANAIGCSKSAVSKCCTGVNHTCKGYIFRFREGVTDSSG